MTFTLWNFLWFMGENLLLILAGGIGGYVVSRLFARCLEREKRDDIRRKSL